MVCCLVPPRSLQIPAERFLVRTTKRDDRKFNPGKKPLDDQMVSMLDDSMFLYWQKYFELQTGKLYVCHFHVSKARGSAFCRQASKNGCAATGFKGLSHIPGQNCFARELDDGTNWNPKSLLQRNTNRTCSERRYKRR